MNRLAILSLIALPIAAVTTIVPAGASTGVHAHVVIARDAGPLVNPLSLPKSKIKGKGSSATYSPTALSAAEDTSGGDCSETPFPSDMKIKNSGTATAYITIYSGGSTPAAFYTLPAGQSVGVCFYNAYAGYQWTFGLSNKKGTKNYAATLTVTLTD